MDKVEPVLTKKRLDELTYNVIGAAIEVQKHVGHGLMENIYHRCLEQELTLRDISYRSELMTPVVYKGITLIADLRCDLFIENCLVVELKCVEIVSQVHKAQLLSYMTLLKAPKGILINFNSYNLFHQGQQTFVNDNFKNLPDG